ncbi:MAG: HPP family protein [Halanaeroarchaeum sp.]
MPTGSGRVSETRAVARRAIARRVIRLRRWLSETSHLERASVLVFAPLLIAVVTYLSNAIGSISFLLFPPLASGTYTLFADPEGEYSSPVKFVGGMTIGAFAGWVALEVSAIFIYDIPASRMAVHPGGAALGLLLTGVLIWVLDLEEPTAFSTALLVLITGTSQLAYVVGVALSSTFVAVVFVVWRESFFEERHRYLYETTSADDRVLVPMRTERSDVAALFGARLAAAHEASKVVLLGMVSEEATERAESDLAEAVAEPTDAEYIEGATSAGEARAADLTARNLEQVAARIETHVGVPTDVVVTHESGDVAGQVLDAADAEDCDLVVAPYETEDGDLAEYIRELFRAPRDVIAFKPHRGETQWKRVMVTVRRAGDVANAMLDYAQRLVGETGSVSVCSIIDEEAERRPAERMLADIVEVATVRTETRVTQSSFEAFLERNDAHYDLVFLGASTDRSGPSRLLNRPAFERVADVETDLAIVHRG